jgi:hypothetical protein
MKKDRISNKRKKVYPSKYTGNPNKRKKEHRKRQGKEWKW